MGDKAYEHHYTDFTGREWKGTALHRSDQEAIDYYLSLQDNGGIKMHSLRRVSNHCEIWRGLPSQPR